MSYQSNNNTNNNTKFLNQNGQENNFLEYIQSLSPETIAQLSKPNSKEVFQVMEQNIVGMLGNLPSEHFNMTINTSRENLGRLLVSAMMSGYFLRSAEQRMDFEQVFIKANQESNQTEEDDNFFE